MSRWTERCRRQGASSERASREAAAAAAGVEASGGGCGGGDKQRQRPQHRCSTTSTSCLAHPLRAVIALVLCIPLLHGLARAPRVRVRVRSRAYASCRSIEQHEIQPGGCGGADCCWLGWFGSGAARLAASPSRPGVPLRLLRAPPQLRASDTRSPAPIESDVLSHTRRFAAPPTSSSSRTLPRARTPRRSGPPLQQARPRHASLQRSPPNEWRQQCAAVVGGSGVSGRRSSARRVL